MLRRADIKRIGRVLLALLMSVLAVAVLSLSSSAFAQSALKNVLLLQSYHPDEPWTRETTAAIEEKLAAVSGAALHTEYLDMRHYPPSPSTFEMLATLFGVKYAHERPDVVMAGGDEAVAFLERYRAQLFPHSPVVFFGQTFPSQSLQSAKNSFFVVEKPDVEGTVRLAAHLHPDVSFFVGVTDSSASGQFLKGELERSVAALSPGKTLLVLENPSSKLLSDKITASQKAAVVIFISRAALTPASGIFEEMSSATDEYNFPIYSPWALWLGRGSVGGSIIDEQQHGIQAASLAVELLNGKRPASVFETAVSHPVFDEISLKRFGIPDSKLPFESEITNRPVRLWQIYPKTTFVLCLLFLVSMVSVWAFVFLDRKRCTAERKYGLLFDNLSSGLAHFRGIEHEGQLVDLEVVEANPVFSRFFRKERSEIVGRRWKEIVDAGQEKSDYWNRICSRVGETGFPAHFEYHVVPKDKWFRISIYSGQKGYLTALMDEISERKRSERVIRQKTERMQLLHSVIVTANRAHSLEECLSEILHLCLVRLGCNTGAAYLIECGSRFVQIAHGEKIFPFVPSLCDQVTFSRVHLTEVPEYGECLFVPLKFKSTLVGLIVLANPHEQACSPEEMDVFTAVGKEAGAAVVKLSSEKDLSQSQKNLTQLFDSIEDFIFVLDMQGRIVFSNRSAAARLGYSPSEMIGMHGYELHPIEVCAPFEDSIERMFEEGVSNLPFFTKERNTLPVETHFTQGYWNGQRAYFAVARDRTVQQEIERSLLAAKQGAEAASNAKTQFIANMSHEIRTPLNAILGFACLISEAELSQRQLKYLNFIRENAEHLSVIVDDILDIAKIESGSLSVPVEDFSLKDLIESSLAAVSGRRKEGVSVGFELDPSLGDFYRGSAIRLKQVLVNLLGNAIKFTSHGHVRLCAFTVGECRGGERVRFEIRDTGKGIKREYLEKMFLPFSQEDASITKRFGGTGLGLFISKKLVELMNGEIRVESQEGKGTKVSLEICMCRSAETEPRALSQFDQNDEALM